MAIIATYRDLSGWDAITQTVNTSITYFVFSAVDPAHWPNGAAPTKFLTKVRFDGVVSGFDDGYQGAFQLFATYWRDGGDLSVIGSPQFVGVNSDSDLDLFSAGRTGASYRLGLRSSGYPQICTVVPTVTLASVYN